MRQNTRFRSAESGPRIASDAQAGSKTRVFLICPVAAFRHALEATLNVRHGLEVVGTEATAAAASLRIAIEDPDVVLLDASTGARARAITTLVAAHPAVAIVAIAVPLTESGFLSCVAAGAAACLGSEAPLETVEEAIRAAVAGESVVSPSMTAMLFRRVATQGPHPTSDARHGVLTPRELEILRLIDRGLSNKQIAAELCLGIPTVKNHVHHILQKLNVGSRWQAASQMRRDLVATSPTWVERTKS